MVGYKNGMAWIWDVGGPSRTAVAIIEHAREQAVISAAFDPTSRYVVTAGDDMVARVWDWASSTTTPVAELHGHAGAVRSATFDHTGQKLVTGSADKQAFVWEWRRTLQPIAVLMDEAGVNSAAFSPRGDWLVTASDDATAKLWKVP